ATKRYRSNLINWGMVPFLMERGLGEKLANGDTILVPGLRSAIAEKKPSVEAWLIHDGKASALTLATGDLTDDERAIILAGCLINFYSQN
ncbi:MAG: hydratase, partial [Desulfovibrionaceae bacterium]|nr:hydratase [Desulfovibrionaceae bacterium]